MTGRAARVRDPEGGYVLVAVLSVMLLVAGLVAGSMTFLRSTLHSVRVGDLDLAASGVLRGGLELTALQLFVIKADPRAVNRRAVRFAGTTVFPVLTDEASKIDLNGSDPRMLLGLFQGIGIDSGSAMSLVTRIVAMRPPKKEGAQGQGPGAGPGDNTTPTQAPQTLDSDEAGGQGAPGQAPQQQAEQKRPRGFQSVDQLRDFPELTAADMKAIAPMLTVYNPDGKIDIMTASADVLSLIPGLTRPKAEDIIAKRDDANKDVIASFDAMLGEAKGMTKTEPGPAFTAHLEAKGPARKYTLDAVIAASKSANEPFYILDWRE